MVHGMVVVRWMRVAVLALVLVGTYELIRPAEPRPIPASTPSPPYIIAISSVARDPKIISRCIQTALRETRVPIHVWGDCPVHDSRVVVHAQPDTLYHQALATLTDNEVVQWVGDHTSHRAIRDPVGRTRWRSRLALDAWAVLSHARSLYSGPILWLENDAILVPGFESKMIMPSTSKFVACHHKGKRFLDVYSGNGAVCIIFGATFDISIILGYHLVEPLDWILLRSSTESSLAFAGATHPGDHKSTRLLHFG